MGWIQEQKWKVLLSAEQTFHASLPPTGVHDLPAWGEQEGHETPIGVCSRKKQWAEIKPALPLAENLIWIQIHKIIGQLLPNP